MGRYAKENAFVIDGPWVIGDDSVLAPAALTAAVNDYDPTGWRSSSVVQVMALEVSTDGGNYNITGLAAPSPALRNMLYIQNVGSSGNVILSSQDVASVAANRFYFNGNITLESMEGVLIVYSPTLSRWTEIARTI